MIFVNFEKSDYELISLIFLVIFETTNFVSNKSICENKNSFIIKCISIKFYGRMRAYLRLKNTI